MSDDVNNMKMQPSEEMKRMHTPQENGIPFLPGISSEADFINDIVVNNTLEGIMIVKGEQIVFSNRAVNDMLEHYNERLDGSIYDMIHKSDNQLIKDVYFRILGGEKIDSFDFRVKMKDGSIKYLMANGMRIKYDEELALLAFVKDITKRKEYEDALELSEKRYRVLVEKSSDIFVEINSEGKQVFVSPVVENITGYKVEELQDKPFAEVIHPEDHAHVFQAWEIAIKTPGQRHRIEYRHIHKTKGYVWVEAHGQSFLNDPNINRIFTFVRDISDRKELELKVRKQQEKYNIIAENISDVIWIFNASQMRFTYISPSVERLRGFTVQEAMEQSISESLAPQSLAIVQKNLIESMERLSKDSTKPIKSIDELQQPCKDGSLIWIEVSSTIQLNSNEEVEVLGVSRNIDDRKKANIALKESEEKYRKLIQNLDEGVLLFDSKKEIVSYNEAAAKIVNIDGSLVGITLDDFKHKTIYEDGTPFLPKDHPANIAIEQKRAVKNVTMGVKHDNGISWIKINAEYILLGENKDGYALVNFYDITRLKEQNEALTQANKTKDKFISIMAHDLKGPFNAILGYAELLVESAKELQNEDILRMSQATYDSSIHAVALLDNLLQWSRAQTGMLNFEPDEINLKKLTEEILLILQSVADSKSIKLLSNFENVESVYGDYNMINTVLRNLISNSIKFSYRGGEVTINCTKTSDFWNVKISDTGVGMKQERVKTLLSNEQPLSNAGTEGEQGTGLGFSIINEFVRHHAGKLEINSVPGKGTTVTVTFPMS